jgi:hypothetical protein
VCELYIRIIWLGPTSFTLEIDKVVYDLNELLMNGE